MTAQMSLDERQQRLAQLTRMRRDAFAQFLEFDDEIKFLLGGAPSAFEALLGFQAPPKAPIEVDTIESIREFDWIDSSNMPVALAVGVKPLRLNIADNIPEREGRGFFKLSFIELGVNNITSSHVSAIACEFKREKIIGVDPAGPGPDVSAVTESFVTLARHYVRFKGGGLYRFEPYAMSTWANVVAIAKMMSQDEKGTMTVGEFVERVIKAKHNLGQATCEKLEGRDWVPVLNKAQKEAAGIKPAKRGTGKKAASKAPEVAHEQEKALGVSREDERMPASEPVVAGQLPPVARDDGGPTMTPTLGPQTEPPLTNAPPAQQAQQGATETEGGFGDEAAF